MGTEKSAEPRRTQQERRDEAESELLRAASELIAEQGISKTSLAKIGERAGYSRGLVNYHFKTKDALIERLVERSQLAFDSIRAHRVQGNALETIMVRLETFVRMFYSPEGPSPTLIVMWGAALPKEYEKEAICEAEKRALQNLEELLVQGQADGSIRVGMEIRAASFMMLGMGRGIGAELLLTPDVVTAEELIEEMKACMRRYLQP